MAASVPPVVPAPPPPAATPADESVHRLLVLARSLAFLVAFVAGILFLVFLVLGIIEALLGAVPTALGLMLYAVASAVVNFLLWRELPRFESLATQRQYGLLRDPLLLWAALGLVFFLVDGIVLLVAWAKVDALVVKPAAPAPPPAAATANPATCPRCGSAGTWLPEYGRYYCYRCSAYV
jgi:hypothetical protein